MDEERKNMNNYNGDADEFVVEDGIQRIPVYNQDHEQIGLFKFNPTDINIVNRYNEVADQFDDVIAPLKDAGVTKDGEGTDDESIELINEAEKRLIELLDYMLGSDSREAFFTKVHAFTPVNGNFYCENVFKSIGSFIEKKHDVEINRLHARIENHTHGYRTGKHKRGDR